MDARKEVFKYLEQLKEKTIKAHIDTYIEEPVFILLNRARVKATVLIEAGRLYITDVDKYKTVVVSISVDAIRDISKKEYSNTIKEVFFIVANDIRYKILIEE